MLLKDCAKKLGVQYRAAWNHFRARIYGQKRSKRNTKKLLKGLRE